MKLTLELPVGCDVERRWVADTLLGTFLGLPFQIRITEHQDVRLTDGQKDICLPDIFFADVREDWGGETCPSSSARAAVVCRPVARRSQYSHRTGTHDFWGWPVLVV